MTHQIIVGRGPTELLWVSSDLESNTYECGIRSIGRHTQLPDLFDILTADGSEATIVVSGPADLGLVPVDLLAVLEDTPWSTELSTTGWYTIRHTDKIRRVNLGIRAAAPTDPFIKPGRSVADVATLLASWLHLTGIPYSHNPGHTATRDIIDMTRGRIRLDITNHSTGEIPIPPRANLGDLRYHPGYTGPAHRWDMRSAYLAAMAATTLPTRRLQHTGYDTDGTDPGYYFVRAHERLPLFLNGIFHWDGSGGNWVGQAMLEVLKTFGPIEINDSWTAPEGGARILRPWAEKWRDYLATPDLQPTIGRALKLGYAQAVGLMNVPHGLYRPDWRHLIIDTARASLLRRILRVANMLKLLPAKIDVDSVWYAVDETPGAPWHYTIGQALGEGDKIGNMRYEGIEEL